MEKEINFATQEATEPTNENEARSEEHTSELQSH